MSTWPSGRLVASVSGGRTSMYMARLLQQNWKGEIRYVFANTGCEDERTLVFIDRCDREWGLGVEWIEAVVHHGERRSCTGRRVDFKTASRNGEPFEEIIRKYGIANKKFPHCTRELKTRPIRAYIDETGWSGCYVAIGIRADEPDRIDANASKLGFLYPLANLAPITKPEINEWWRQQPFDLGLLDYEGNCQWCWKKSIRKLIRIATEAPERFAFPMRMEQEYGGVTRKGTAARITFFRENRSAQDIITMAELLKPQGDMFRDYPDEDSGCSESCEPFGENAA